MKFMKKLVSVVLTIVGPIIYAGVLIKEKIEFEISEAKQRKEDQKLK